MKKPQKKQSWPNQYLVVCRTNLDELPLLLTTSRTEAKRYAKNVPAKHIDRSAEVMGVDHAGRVVIAIVTFRKGVPSKLDLIQDCN